MIQHAFPSCYNTTICFSAKQSCAPALLLAHVNICTNGARNYMCMYIKLHKICDQCRCHANLWICRVAPVAGGIFLLNELKPVFLWNWNAGYLHEECKYLEIILVTLGRSSYLGKDKVQRRREERLKMRTTGQQVSEDAVMYCLVLRNLHNTFSRDISSRCAHFFF